MKGIKINWTPEMDAQIKAEFPTRFNKELAEELGVSWRSLVRRARFLGVEKEAGFLEDRSYFKPGESNPMSKQDNIDKMKHTQAETIRRERLRIKYGMPRLTKMTLKK